MLAASDLLERARVVVVAGTSEQGAEPLLRAALGAADPAICVLRAEPGEDYPEGSPAHGRAPVNGMAAAYVCRDMVCGLPTTSADELTRDLARVA